MVVAAAGPGTAAPEGAWPLLRFDAQRLGPLPTTGFRVVRDVAYYTGPDADPVKHRADLYLPAQGNGAPVVVFVHGGGWISGDKDYRGGLYGNVGIVCARAGMVGVVVNYRLSPAVKHPAHVRDVVRAVKWVYQHIAEYGGDPHRLVLSGHSAGGHLAALAALDERYLNEVGLPGDCLSGVAALSGVYNVSRMARARFARRLMVEPAFGTESDLWDDASPLNHVRRGAPPFLLVNAARDATLPLDTRELAGALRAHGVPVETWRVPDTNHCTEIARVGREGDRLGPKLVDFVRRVTSNR